MARRTAQQKMSAGSEREALLLAVRQSRGELRDGLLETRDAADVSSRFKASFQRNRLWWVGGSLVAGLLLASASSGGGDHSHTGNGGKRSGKKKRVFVKGLFSLFQIIVSLSGPVLKSMITKEVVAAFKTDRP